MTKPAPSQDQDNFAAAIVGAARTARMGIVVSDCSEGAPRYEFVNEFALTLIDGPLGRLAEVFPLLSDLRAQLDGVRGANGSSIPITAAATHNTRPIDVVASRTTVENHLAETLFLFDTAPRRDAERALRASEARFRKLLDAAPDAVAIGTRTRFMYANPALVRLLGYERMEDVISVPVREHLHPDDRGLGRRLAAALLQTGQPQPPTAIRALRKDGHIAHVELRTMGTEWDGQPALLGIARDLSERRRTQAQLIRADRLAAVGTLAAGIAHEINNPLAYVLLNLQYLVRELQRLDDSPKTVERLLERLAEAQHGARRVSTIVSDLRAFARPEREEQGPVSVLRVIESALKVAGNHIRHRARVVENLESVPPVEASAARLEQVFVNLIVNAAQAIPEGKPDENQIRIVARSQGERVVVEISDTGAGIAPELMDRVFDPFFTTKPRGTGTGLGLPISHSIVASYGGEIQLESEPGRGTTFRVILPALREVESDQFVTPRPVVIGTERWTGRLLVIDDEPLVADMLERILGEHHDVTIATDPEKAMELLLARDFDLVFCDLLMPRLSGMDLYAELKAQRPGTEARLVFMTGGAFTPRASQFLATVKNRTIAKPFDLEEIGRVLADCAAHLSNREE